MTNLLMYCSLYPYLEFDEKGKTKLLRAAKTGPNNLIDNIIKSFVNEYKKLEIREDIRPERIILYQSSLFSKKSILHYLFKYGDWHTIKTLYTNYKEEVTRLLFEQDRKSNLPIHYAAQNLQEGSAILTELKRIHNQMQATGKCGRNPYHYAAMVVNPMLFSDLTTFSPLISIEPDLNGNRILHFAARSGNKEFYSAINNRNTSNNQTQRNMKYRLPIYYAIKFNHIDLVRLIISENPRISLDLVDLIASVRHQNKQIYDLIKPKVSLENPVSKEMSNIKKFEMEKIKYDFYENEQDFRTAYQFASENNVLLKAILNRKDINITKTPENKFFIEVSKVFSAQLEITEKNLHKIFRSGSRQMKTVQYLLEEQEDLSKLITSATANKVSGALVSFAAFLQQPDQIVRLIRFLERVEGTNFLLEAIMKELLFSASVSGNFIGFLEIYKYWLSTNKAVPINQIVGIGTGNDDDGINLLHASASSGDLPLLILIKSLSELPFEKFVVTPNNGDLGHSLYYSLRAFNQPQHCFSSFLQREESFYFLISYLRNYDYVNVHNNSILHMLAELSPNSNFYTISEPMMRRMFEAIFFKCYKSLIKRNHGGKTPGELLKLPYLSYFVAPHTPILMKDFIPKIQISSDFLTQRIANGQFACVYKVEFYSKPAAAKLLFSSNPSTFENGPTSPFETNTFKEIESKNKFFNELSMLYRCNHPNILRFNAFAETAHGPVIISEYIEKPLSYFIDKKLPLSAIISIGIDIIGAISYLHSMVGAVHRDIHSENILVIEHTDTSPLTYTPKLVDFGESLFLHPELKSEMFYYTPKTKHSLIANYKRIHTQRNPVHFDYFSLALCLLELHSGTPITARYNPLSLNPVIYPNNKTELTEVLEGIMRNQCVTDKDFIAALKTVNTTEGESCPQFHVEEVGTDDGGYIFPEKDKIYYTVEEVENNGYVPLEALPSLL